jgi:CDP-diacylglycerol--glycerol-3-phosphate 3-phosphatidyltransferase
MAKIFNVSARAIFARIFDPPARWLLRLGVSPDAVTAIGTLGVVFGSVFFAVTGQFITGTVIVTLSAFTDLIDGAMARARGRSSKFGAFLDSTCDRVADGAIFGAVAYWLGAHDRTWGAAAALVCLVAGQVVSYAKARAEGLGMTANVGIVERAERLVAIGIGGLLTGFGVKYGIDVVLGVLAILSIVTIGQRVATVYRQDRAATLEREAGGGGPGGTSATRQVPETAP